MATATAMQPSKQPKKISRELLWEMAIKTVSPYTFSQNANSLLEDFIDEAVSAIKINQRVHKETRNLEIKNNFMLLLNAIKESVESLEAEEITELHVKKALFKLCPLFPFC